MAEMGIIPAGAYANREYLEKDLFINKSVSLAMSDVLFDPQTAGGLLISIPQKEGFMLLSALKDHIPLAVAIGVVEEKGAFSIIVE